MKWLTTTVGALFVVVGVLWSLGTATPVKAGSADVFVPRSLAITACEVKEFVWAYDETDVGLPPVRYPVDEVPEGYGVIPPEANGYKDLDWNIVNGELDCKHEIVELTDMGEMQGAPSIGADFSRAIGCTMAAMSYAPLWAESHPGWWPFAIGCPNPIYSDEGTPGDTTDDRIVGYKMPECPREINGIAIKCKFSENEI